MELTGIGYEYAGVKKNKYLYNGKELIEDAGLQYYDYGARMYDPAIGRFGTIDPAGDFYKSWTPYHYVLNNPIKFIDPTGMFTELFNENGKKIGEDENGIDGNIAIVTNNEEVSRIRSNSKNGKHTESSSLNSIVNLPSAKIREEMGKAVTRSNQPSGNDTKGGFHEEGGIFGTGNRGSDQVIHALPGEVAIPGVDEYASVDPFSGETADNYLNDVEGTFHTHPSGRNSAGGFDQDPSDFINNNNERVGDIPTAKFQSIPGGGRYVRGNHYVLGTGNNRVTIYNGSNPSVATFPLSKLTSIGIK